MWDDVVVECGGFLVVCYDREEEFGLWFWSVVVVFCGDRGEYLVLVWYLYVEWGVLVFWWCYGVFC